jgi:hypothetical protein
MQEKIRRTGKKERKNRKKRIKKTSKQSLSWDIGSTGSLTWTLIGRTVSFLFSFSLSAVVRARCRRK